ncbi:MAG: hypothetical protein ACOH19_07725 [Rhodoglobus sp.]
MTTPFYTPSSASTPSSKRPGTVTAGIVIVSVGVVLGLVLLLLAFGTIATLGPSPQVDAVRVALIVSTAVIVGNAVGIVLIIVGYGWARFLLIATGALGIITSLVSGGGLAFGDALYLLAIVLLFLRPSSEYFAARAAQRSATSSAA